MSSVPAVEPSQEAWSLGVIFIEPAELSLSRAPVSHLTYFQDSKHFLKLTLHFAFLTFLLNDLSCEAELRSSLKLH